MRTVTAARPKLNILLSFLLAMGTIAVAPHQAKHATNYMFRASAESLATDPVKQVCDVRGSASLCANRSGGGTVPGTSVIAWSANDSNNAFDWIFLNMCSGGRVSTNPPCPFTSGGGLNARYNGAWIAALQDLETGLCVANLNGATILEPCPDAHGNGGANGTIFVLPQANPGNYVNGATTYAVNRYWSNNPAGGNGTSPRWLCVIGRGFSLTENSPTGDAGTCQWQEHCSSCPVAASNTTAPGNPSAVRGEVQRRSTGLGPGALGR